MEMITVATGFEATLTVTGLWGRKRKIQSKSFQLTDDLKESDDLDAMAAGKLAEIGAKPHTRWQVRIYPWEQKQWADGRDAGRLVRLSFGAAPVRKGIVE